MAQVVCQPAGVMHVQFLSWQSSCHQDCPRQDRRLARLQSWCSRGSQRSCGREEGGGQLSFSLRLAGITKKHLEMRHPHKGLGVLIPPRGFLIAPDRHKKSCGWRISDSLKEYMAPLSNAVQHDQVALLGACLPEDASIKLKALSPAFLSSSVDCPA